MSTGERKSRPLQYVATSMAPLSHSCTINLPPPVPRRGNLRTQELKFNLVRTESLKVFPLKPGVGKYAAIHATFNARDFFFVYFYPSGPFTSIFFQNLCILQVLPTLIVPASLVLMFFCDLDDHSACTHYITIH